jgi:hypothetical protein
VYKNKPIFLKAKGDSIEENKDVPTMLAPLYSPENQANSQIY